MHLLDRAHFQFTRFINAKKKFHKFNCIIKEKLQANCLFKFKQNEKS